MLSQFRNLILTPRFWLSLGVFCFGASIVLSYHQDQMAAKNVLAEKVTLPPQVLIQDFVPSRHSNILNEVQLLAEAALTQTVTLNIGTESAAKWMQFTPVYAVGSVGKPFAETYLSDASGDPRRPMPRDHAAQLASEAQSIQRLDQVPMGLVLIEDDSSVKTAGLLDSLGEGQNGPLVLITGFLLNSTSVSEQITVALAEDGVSIMRDTPIFVPYQAGERLAGQVDDYSSIRNLLEWISLVMILIGVAQVFNLFKPRPKPAEVSVQEVEALGAFPSVFQPIRTQADLVREEQKRSEEEGLLTRSKISRMIQSN